MDAPNQSKNSGTPFDENTLRAVIRKATKGRRHIIAARMTKLLRREDNPITPKAFTEFCRKSPGKRHTRFPAFWVKAFCEAVGSDELWKSLAPEFSRRALAASSGIAESRDAVARAQDALTKVQEELASLAERKRHRKAKGMKR
jgi:hypothetical protein